MSSPVVKAIIDDFIFRWDGREISVDFIPNDNRSANHWAKDDPEFPYVLKRASRILEAMGFPALSAWYKRDLMEEDLDLTFKSCRVSFRTPSPHFIDWRKPDELYIPYHDFLEVYMYTELAVYYIPQILRRFEEEKWFERLSSAEVTMEEAQENFDKLYHGLYSAIATVPEDYKQALAYIKKKLDKERGYARRLEELNIYAYFILGHCQGFCNEVKAPQDSYKASYDINDDGGSLMLQEGNEEEQHKEEFFQFIRSLTPHGIIEWPPNRVYTFNLSNIDELEEVVRQTMDEWTPEEFNLPERVLCNYEWYNEMYERFYNGDEDAEWFEKIFNKSNLLALIQRDINFWRPHYTKEYEIGNYLYGSRKYLDQVLLSSIRECFEAVWESPFFSSMENVEEFIQISIMKAGGHM